MSDSLKISPKLAIPDKWTETETAYIAGLVDGEGCIGIYERWNRGYFIQLTLVNTSEGFAKWLSKVMGANAVRSLVDRRPRNKQSYSVTLDRMRAFSVLKKIQPFLRIKRAQADLAISFKKWQNRRKLGSPFAHRKYSQKDRDEAEKFVQRSRQLNQKGKA